MELNIYVLVMSVFSLVIGLILYWLSVRSIVSYFQTTNLISWLLIALFPVLLIFSFFPSSFSWTIKGASMGGAIGAFIFIWLYGTKMAKEAFEVDEPVIESLPPELRLTLKELRSTIKNNGNVEAVKDLFVAISDAV